LLFNGYSSFAFGGLQSIEIERYGYILLLPKVSRSLKLTTICCPVLMGHSRKHPYHPHRGNLNSKEVNPPTPFGCPNTFTIIRNSPPPPDGRNFLCGGSMDLFWNDPMRSDLLLLKP
jgi:hypothetical protein